MWLLSTMIPVLVATTRALAKLRLLVKVLPWTSVPSARERVRLSPADVVKVLARKASLVGEEKLPLILMTPVNRLCWKTSPPLPERPPDAVRVAIVLKLNVLLWLVGRRARELMAELATV